jgi:hypothetical protein
MGILSFRITEPNQVIKLDRQIHGQNMTLKKIVIIKNKDQTVSPLYNYKGGVTISLDFLKGGLMLASNVNNDEISVPFKQEEDVTHINWDLNFESETIDQYFNVSVFNFDRTGQQPVFDPTGLTPNALMFIDLYFDFASLYDYNKY